MKISVDLSNLQGGRQEIVLSSDTIKIPSNLSLVTIKPEAITINAYKLYPVDVPVRIKTVESLQPGLKLLSIISSPDVLSVQAPMRLIQNKGQINISTEPIDLSKITQTTTLETKVVAQPEVRFKNGQTLTIKITVEVESTEKQT